MIGQTYSGFFLEQKTTKRHNQFQLAESIQKSEKVNESINVCDL